MLEKYSLREINSHQFRFGAIKFNEWSNRMIILFPTFHHFNPPHSSTAVIYEYNYFHSALDPCIKMTALFGNVRPFPKITDSSHFRNNETIFLYATVFVIILCFYTSFTQCYTANIVFPLVILCRKIRYSEITIPWTKTTQPPFQNDFTDDRQLRRKCSHFFFFFTSFYYY